MDSLAIVGKVFSCDRVSFQGSVLPDDFLCSNVVSTSDSSCWLLLRGCAAVSHLIPGCHTCAEVERGSAGDGPVAWRQRNSE